MLEWGSGFENISSSAHLAAGGALFTSNNAGTSTTTARTGSRSLLLSSGAAIAYKTGLSNASTRHTGIGMDFLDLLASASRVIFAYADGIPTTAGNCQVSFQANPDGSISAYRGRALGATSGGTLLGSSAAGAIPASNAWYFLEFSVTFHASTGTVEVFVNDVSVLSLTGQNTISTANAYANAFGINGITNGVYMDDIYLVTGTGGTTTTRLGPGARFWPMVASAGDGTNAQFTPSTGTDNGAMVDDSTPDDDTTYNSSTTIGNKDTYNFAALGRTGDVKGVFIRNMCRSDSGAAGVRNIARIGGTDYFSGAMALTTSYTLQVSIHELSPATSSPWTVSEIDGAEFGVEHNS